MSPVPWPLCGRTAPAPPPAAATMSAEVLAQVRDPGLFGPRDIGLRAALEAARDMGSVPPAQRPGTWRTSYEHDTSWVAPEAAVLDLLADAGGDLHAHRTVHLEDR